MEGLQFDKSSLVLSLKKLPKPTISLEDEIIVEVAYAGLCGTDLHILGGHFPCSPTPFTPGHEFSGVVSAVGTGVRHVKPGDRVVVDPQSWCNTCRFCTVGKYHLCPEGFENGSTGIRYDGGWAHYVRARVRQVYLLPQSLSLKQGALCEPVSCIVWPLERVVSKFPVGSDILISGAGIIGNLWSAVLHHLGHRRVTVVEPSKERLLINADLDTGFRGLSPEELKSKLATGERFDLAVDCSGNVAALEQALDALKPGGTLLIFGVASPQARMSVSPYEIFKRELTIVGSVINPFSMRPAIGLMEAMGDRYLNYDKLGIRLFELKDYEKAVSALKSGSVAKATFQISPHLE